MRPPDERRGRWLHAAAFAWGLAEATFFFLVPDVLLTMIAQRRGFRSAAVATIFTVLGAAIGGALMWWLGRDHREAVLAFLDCLPAISPEMIADAEPAMTLDPFAALLSGAFSGVPYKVFAAVAAHADLSAIGFLLLTIPARAARFLLASAVTVVADRVLARWITRRARIVILVGGWVAFYTAYWSLMPN